eukprot:TRINITY_DN14680_c0_g1_i1.p1 TRINITY_DN14680_c0_g1~~TRINITY_DN14680_c0_g1_i1.p1  ORF type:complete len:413 (+),score=31.80 TRINITY_DN14680_c0_g1_i1:56-1240(+)
MAAVPSDEHIRRGRYSIGLSHGENGELCGDVGISIPDLKLSGWRRLREDGRRAMRGGTSSLVLQYVVSGQSAHTQAVLEGDCRAGRAGVAASWRSLPTQTVGRSTPSWIREEPVRRCREGRLFYRSGFGAECWCRLKDESAGASSTPVAAIGGSAGRSWGSKRVGGAATVLAELGVLPVFVRGEVSSLLNVVVLHRSISTSIPGVAPPWIEVRGSAKALQPLLPPPLGAPPPRSECYAFGGRQVRGFTESGLCPASPSQTGGPVPATAVVHGSVALMAPLDDKVGVFGFADAGSASGSGPTNPRDGLPLWRGRRRGPESSQPWLTRKMGEILEPVLAEGDRWATPALASCGVGFFLCAAPHIRAGVAWPIGERLNGEGMAHRRQGLFFAAEGTV